MKLSILNACAVSAVALSFASPAAAQVFGGSDGADDGAATQAAPSSSRSGRQSSDGDGRPVIEPYIEVSQIGVFELSPGDDAATYTQIAAGVDASITGRNNGGSVSVRYERNIGYSDDDLDSGTLSGVARGYASIIPQTLTVQAGALASRTRVDTSGGVTSNPLVGDDAESKIYSAYAGPSLTTSVGDVAVNANYRVGYTRVEAPDTPAFVPGVDGGIETVDIFDDSVNQAAAVHLATTPGEPLPVGLGIGAGWTQEDISNLDQRVRDVYVRGDVTVPVTPTFAVVGGIGYEDVEVSSRDAVVGADGVPVLDDNGRFVTDGDAPRQLAYDVSGLIWDVGVVWRPSSRTSLAATVGRRYDSTTYYGTFDWAPDNRSSVSVSAYDAITGFGGQLNNALVGLPTQFSAARNALSSDFNGCVAGAERGGCVTGALGSVRSAVFRNRGIGANYSRTFGRYTTGIGIGYDRRTFISGAGTVLASADGTADESYYINANLQGELGRNASFTLAAYANYFDSEFGDGGDLLAFGSSAAYQRTIASRLSARAALALDYLDTDSGFDDVAAASALVGLRYDF